MKRLKPLKSSVLDNISEIISVHLNSGSVKCYSNSYLKMMIKFFDISDVDFEYSRHLYDAA